MNLAYNYLVTPWPSYHPLAAQDHISDMINRDNPVVVNENEDVRMTAYLTLSGVKDDHALVLHSLSAFLVPDKRISLSIPMENWANRRLIEFNTGRPNQLGRSDYALDVGELPVSRSRNVGWLAISWKESNVRHLLKYLTHPLSLNSQDIRNLLIAPLNR